MNRSDDESVASGWLFRFIFGVTILTILLVVILALCQQRPRFASMPDFSTYSQIDQMKAAFIDYLTPIVEYYNARILEDRERLNRVSRTFAAGNKLSWVDVMWLQRLAERYAVGWNKENPKKVVSKLKLRVDIIPVPLVLVQAAKESSWGQSRFAIQANNLFGQWCFNQGCGVEPEQRATGARHEVRKFKTAGESVRSYLHNLNTHRSYADLRRIRQRLREEQRPITAGALADGLMFYSQRRGAYVEEIKSMIAQLRRFQNSRVE